MTIKRESHKSKEGDEVEGEDETVGWARGEGGQEEKVCGARSMKRFLGDRWSVPRMILHPEKKSPRRWHSRCKVFRTDGCSASKRGEITSWRGRKKKKIQKKKSKKKLELSSCEPSRRFTSPLFQCRPHSSTRRMRRKKEKRNRKRKK